MDPEVSYGVFKLRQMRWDWSKFYEYRWTDYLGNLGRL